MGKAVALNDKLRPRLRVLRWNTPRRSLNFWALALLLDRARWRIERHALNRSTGKYSLSRRLRYYTWLTTGSVTWASYLRVHQKHW